MVENSILDELLKVIRKETNLLKEIQKIDKETYIKDIKVQHIVEHAFQLAVQACIDIGARVISQKNLQTPANYHEIFNILTQEKIISEELDKKVCELVGFRNAIVHEYRVINNEEVYRHLQESLQTITKFVEAIVKL